MYKHTISCPPRETATTAPRLPSQSMVEAHAAAANGDGGERGSSVLELVRHLKPVVLVRAALHLQPARDIEHRAVAFGGRKPRVLDDLVQRRLLAQAGGMRDSRRRRGRGPGSAPAWRRARRTRRLPLERRRPSRTFGLGSTTTAGRCRRAAASQKNIF